MYIFCCLSELEVLPLEQYFNYLINAASREPVLANVVLCMSSQNSFHANFKLFQQSKISLDDIYIEELLR